MTVRGVSWAEFYQADPVLAEPVRARFESHRHAVMATVRADGSPRLSGMEAPIRSGHLWLAMMRGSRKSTDLDRDPRFSLHSAPDVEDLPSGDARIDGIAVAADSAQQASFVAGHRFPVEDPSTMVLWVALIQRVVLVRVSGDELVIESWTPSRDRIIQRLK